MNWRLIFENFENLLKSARLCANIINRFCRVNARASSAKETGSCSLDENLGCDTGIASRWTYLQDGC